MLTMVYHTVCRSDQAARQDELEEARRDVVRIRAVALDSARQLEEQSQHATTTEVGARSVTMDVCRWHHTTACCTKQASWSKREQHLKARADRLLEEKMQVGCFAIVVDVVSLPRELNCGNVQLERRLKRASFAEGVANHRVDAATQELAGVKDECERVRRVSSRCCLLSQESGGVTSM